MARGNVEDNGDMDLGQSDRNVRLCYRNLTYIRVKVLVMGILTDSACLKYNGLYYGACMYPKSYIPSTI